MSDPITERFELARDAVIDCARTNLAKPSLASRSALREALAEYDAAAFALATEYAPVSTRDLLPCE